MYIFDCHSMCVSNTKANYLPYTASLTIIWKTISNKWLNVKLGLVDTYRSSFIIQTQKSKSLNYDAYEKLIFNYVFGLAMLKKEAILLHA